MGNDAFGLRCHRLHDAAQAHFGARTRLIIDSPVLSGEGGVAVMQRPFLNRPETSRTYLAERASVFGRRERNVERPEWARSGPQRPGRGAPKNPIQLTSATAESECSFLTRDSP